uniref:B30.2/SPRY domain-containing protein n=1 Tax=Chelydra serpentina TaxID=8475 RepID=A0A8C3XUY2_CHESE
MPSPGLLLSPLLPRGPFPHCGEGVVGRGVEWWWGTGLVGGGRSAQGVPTAHSERVRVFRAEQCYAVRAGRWYFEFEAVTTGEMRVGWARPDVRPDVELGADELAYVFNGHRGQRWHVGSEPFGRSWQPGDVVGCMIDLTENHIMFTLNGEMLISDSGSELAFKDIEIGEGFLPVCSLGLAQVGRLNLGQEVSSLRFFPICGLQEGFEPFAINMKRDISMWFSKSLPQFSPLPAEHPHYEVRGQPGGRGGGHSPPAPPPSSAPSFLFKAKKAAFSTPPPAVPSVQRLEEDVVPDDRDDPEIIMNTTTVPGRAGAAGHTARGGTRGRCAAGSGVGGSAGGAMVQGAGGSAGGALPRPC